jgi:transposase
MIQAETAKWGQDETDLLRLSVESEHARSRERFLALYMISSGQTNATQWSGKIGRSSITVIGWVHTYNRKGPQALRYRRTGGRPPLFAQNRSNRSSQR